MKGIRPLALLVALLAGLALTRGGYAAPLRTGAAEAATPSPAAQAGGGQADPGPAASQAGGASLTDVASLAADASVEASPGSGIDARGMAARARGAAESILAQDPGARVSYDPETGLVRFIASGAGHALTNAAGAPSGAAPQAGGGTPSAPQGAAQGAAGIDAAAESAARRFLASNGALFGLAGQGAELTVMRTRAGEDGGSFVRFQQQAGGAPVLGGELIVQMDPGGNVLSAGGKTLPAAAALPAGSHPRVDGGQAAAQAKEAVAAAYAVDAAALTAAEPSLWMYSPRLLGAPGPQIDRLVWRTEVQADNAPVREFVLVDAGLGGVALRFSMIETAKYRLVYDMGNQAGALPGTLVRSEGQSPLGNNLDANQFYDYGGDFYDYYLAVHARDSIDGLGMALVGTVHYCETGSPCPYDNAYWSGSQMVFGQGYTDGLDLVAHEMTHGVTQHESNLFYFFEPGAINESLSDLWGELVEDYTNPGGDPTWRVGEDAPGGAIRSMSNPPTYGQPDSMSSPNYFCGETDGGGVHTNSGVGNKAAYLMAEGGPGITKIGTLKTAKIYYTAQTRLLTSGADYLDLYNALQQACTTLTGTLGITGADCQNVKAALDAVQMAAPSPCRTQPVDAPVCPAGQLPRNLFYDNLENTGSGNWVKDANWFYPPATNNYGNFPAIYATSGVQNFWGADPPDFTTHAIQMARDVALPAGTPYLRFNYASAFRWTGTAANPAWLAGGVVEYSTNGGASWQLMNPTWFDNGNGYNGQIVAGTANPLQGQQAFVGDSYGYRSTRINLSSLAPGNVRVRFRIGSYNDGSTVVNLGWFLDDIQFYTCVTRPAGFTTYVPLIIMDWPWAPAAPALNAINNPAGSPDYAVTWRPVPGAGIYLMQEATAPDFSNALLYDAGAATSFQRSGKAAGTYYYRVKARNNFGESGWSNSQWTMVAPQPNVPDPPVLLPIANPSGGGNYTVAWNTAARATSYTLIEDTDPAFLQPLVVYQGPGTWLTVTGKQPGLYYYAVRGVNAGGTSPWSVVQSTQVGPAPGYWQSSDRSQSFNVGSSRTSAYDFSVWVAVGSCGTYQIVHSGPDPIVNNQFGFSGAFYGSVTFNSPSTATGSAGLNSYYVPGCGYAQGGPWAVNYGWQQNAQAPQVYSAEVVRPDDGGAGR